MQLVHDVVDMIDKTDETRILVSLDQEKAFNRVDHEFLSLVLVQFSVAGLISFIIMFFPT